MADRHTISPKPARTLDAARGRLRAPAAVMEETVGPSRFVAARNHFRRDHLLSIGSVSYAGGVKPFGPIDPVLLRRLLDEGFVDGDARVGGRPSVREMLRFAGRWPTVRFHGHAVDPRRADYGARVDAMVVTRLPDDALDARQRHEFEAFTSGGYDVVETVTETRATWA